jgi:hypothetical protein
MELSENGIVFNGVVYEDSIVPIRSYLKFIPNHLSLIFGVMILSWALQPFGV